MEPPAANKKNEEVYICMDIVRSQNRDIKEKTFKENYIPHTCHLSF